MEVQRAAFLVDVIPTEGLPEWRDLREATCFSGKFGSARLSQCKREHRHDFVMTARALCRNRIHEQRIVPVISSEDYLFC